VNPPISWDLIPMFLAVAEELQLGSAARRLGISRQTLSRNINRLEQELGTPVLVRSTRRVELTRAGATLRDHALAIEQAMARAVAQARVDHLDHTLTIGVSTDLITPWYDSVQRWISERGTPAALERRGSDDALHLVRAGSLDLALLIGGPEEPGAVVVGREPLVVVFPAEHPAATQDAVRQGDLSALLIAVSDSLEVPYRHRIVERLQGDPSLPYVVAPRVGTSAPGLVQTVRAQGAATVLLARGLDEVDTTGLAVLPLDPPLTAPVLLIPRPRLAPETFEDLADHLREADAGSPLSLACG
jgi:DNA-binding transcriptional LysR family regulator